MIPHHHHHRWHFLSLRVKLALAVGIAIWFAAGNVVHCDLKPDNGSVQR